MNFLFRLYICSIFVIDSVRLRNLLILFFKMEVNLIIIFRERMEKLFIIGRFFNY